MLKTNYRISKNLKVVLAAFLLCAQFLLIVTDAFSIEQDHLFSNELCTENTLIELSDAYDLDTGSDCDHCCSCHGHFTHIAFSISLSQLLRLARTKTCNTPYNKCKSKSNTER